MIKLSKGLDIPITGSPVQQISAAKTIRTVAVLGEDFVGMKPSMLVQIGDKVSKGQALFEDKKNPGVIFTSPVSGVVREINRGDKRVFQSLVIEIQGQDKFNFKSFLKRDPASLAEQEVRSLLIESGAWTYLRTRPFSKTPAIDAKPSSIFINAMDTNPLAANPEVIISEKAEDFRFGIEVLSKLAPKTFVVTSKDSKIDLKNIANVKHEQFAGPHPAGNVGTHIHYLDPVSPTKTVWHINYQDVIAVGYLFRNGEILNEKVVSLAGPIAKNPRLIRTLRGANLAELTNDEATDSAVRVVSGSVLGGRKAAGPMN
jgi:Na+-transporting NADH:ubiquinone oxidoreductase subunit A